MFLRNVGWHWTAYTALYPRRQTLLSHEECFEKMCVPESHEMSAKFQAAINWIILKNNTSTWVRFPTDMAIHIVKKWKKLLFEYKHFIWLSYLQHSNFILLVIYARGYMRWPPALPKHNLARFRTELVAFMSPRIVPHGSSSSSLHDVAGVHYLLSDFSWYIYIFIYVQRRWLKK
jgi:hypothetical protein